jgi:indolepyruvate ferredoxin oxidoreductase beta subunit
MGDGGFWHNGLITGVTSNLFNKGDGVLIVMQNGYASATGQQYLPSSSASRLGAAPGMDIEQTLRSLGVTWMRKVRTYGVAKMTATLKEAMRTTERGLKVIIADGECQLARQRRVRAEDAEKLKRGERVTKTRYGVDDAICTGDHSCIRLSGCPSLTVKPNPDPLRSDPVAAVVESCVGCGLCGEVAHAAVLCPSFYRAEVVRNPGAWDRMMYVLRSRMISLLGGALATRSPPPHSPSKTGVNALSLGEGQGGGMRGKTEQGHPLPTPLPQAGEGAPPSMSRGSDSTQRPIKLLIGALGGEGGGVLTNWIVTAAEQLGFPVQSTSIPGVAQRTGATTYYIEIMPVKARGSARPVLALSPGVGDIDVMMASELMEAGRAVVGGFVTPDRTVSIASTSRFYVMGEKIAMGDGRYDSAKLAGTIKDHSKAHILIDMDAIARSTGAFINSVMLGVLAGSGQLPIPDDAFAAAIRADGKGVDGNLRGFRAGLEAAQGMGPSSARPRESGDPVDSRLRGNERMPEPTSDAWPEVARDIIHEGVRRLTAYQDEAYARLYLDRLAPIRDADARANAGGHLLRETARHLALRMSYEDVIRVAQAKIDPARFARIAQEVAAKSGEPVKVFEFLKPGVDEFCSVLPPTLARRILAFAEQRPKLARFHWGMEVNTTSVSGYLRFRTLAALRRFRPRTYRYAEEQREIERWLGLIAEAAPQSVELALEIAECARLIKGYGDTHKRGTGNYRLIEQHVIRPALAGRWPLRQAVDAVVSARTAALVDPEGESLAKCLDAIGTAELPRIAAE